MKINSHKDTFIKLEELGRDYPYVPTFDFGKTYIDRTHQFFSQCPMQETVLIHIKNGRWWGGDTIKGWLRQADALKLYELAYFAQGNILELGSYHGLSTCILSAANYRSPYRKHIYSVDLDAECIRQTKYNVKKKGLSRDVSHICADATSALESFATDGKKFSFAFIDHSHAYTPVYSVCQILDKIMIDGGFCLFHDFNDPRNNEVNYQDYGVYQAVTQGLNPAQFEFYGVYGCTALYRKI